MYNLFDYFLYLFSFWIFFETEVETPGSFSYINFFISHLSVLGLFHYVLGGLFALIFQFVNTLFNCMHFIHQSIYYVFFFI